MSNITKLTFKKIDFWLQFTGVLVFFSSSLIYISTSKLDQVSFVSFFLIGFWQVFSSIINFFWLKIDSKSRQFWQIISTFLLFLILIAGFSFRFPNLSFDFVIYFLHFALFLSPILAIWYLVITLSELKEIGKITPEK